MSDGDNFLESKPRPAPLFEPLRDYFQALSARSGRQVDVTMRLDEASFLAQRADEQRPRHPKAERYFALAGPWGLCRFERGAETRPAATAVADLVRRFEALNVDGLTYELRCCGGGHHKPGCEVAALLKRLKEAP